MLSSVPNFEEFVPIFGILNVFGIIWGNHDNIYTHLHQVFISDLGNWGLNMEIFNNNQGKSYDSLMGTLILNLEGIYVYVERDPAKLSVELLKVIQGYCNNLSGERSEGGVPNLGE